MGSLVQHDGRAADPRRAVPASGVSVSRTPRRILAPAAAALLLALAACGGDDDGLATPTSSPSASADAATPTQSPSTAPSEPAGESSARAIYYLKDTDPAGPRLYREFAARPDTGDILGDAVQTMLTRPPDDADYTSLWPTDTQVLATRVEGTTAVVDLSDRALEGQGGSAFEAMSLQQLVHTVTAAEPSTERVQLLIEGEQVETLWGAASIAEPIARAAQIETLGPIWLLTPTEGGTLARGAEFAGTASAFEATVNWQWLQGDTVVAEGFSTASEGAPGRGDWSSPVEVPPGDYVLKAFESSAQDGSELFADTKTVTVTG